MFRLFFFLFFFEISIEYEFTAYKGFDFQKFLKASYLIDTYVSRSLLKCLASCNSTQSCYSAAYDPSANICLLYNKNLVSLNNLIQQAAVNFYSMNCKRIQ